MNAADFLAIQAKTHGFYVHESDNPTEDQTRTMRPLNQDTSVYDLTQLWRLLYKEGYRLVPIENHGITLFPPLNRTIPSFCGVAWDCEITNTIVACERIREELYIESLVRQDTGKQEKSALGSVEWQGAEMEDR